MVGTRLPALLLAALLLAPRAAPAQSRDWTPDDRAVLGDFTRIIAVGTGLDRVVAVTPTSLALYDPVSKRWQGPYTPRDPGALRSVFAAVVDQLDGGVWLIRPDGWLHFDPGIGFWEQGSVAGRVQEVALDEAAPAGGLFLKTSTGWVTAMRGGVAVPSAAPKRPARVPTPNDAFRDNPAIQASVASLTFLGRLGVVGYTAAARAQGFLGRGWYLGTNGAGLVYFAEGAGMPESVPFGMPGDAVDAVFASPGGVWAATERTALADPSLTYVGSGFDNFRWFQGPRASGLPFQQARRIVGAGSALWVATDVGVVRVDQRNEDVQRFDASAGIPDPRVLDLSTYRGRIAAATAHGVAIWSDSTGFVRAAPDFADASLAVLLTADTLWVGTALGLFVSVPGEGNLGRPPALLDSPSFDERVLDLAWRGDTLVALLPNRLLWRDPATGRYTLGPMLGNGLGRLHTMVNARPGLYIAGERGVGLAKLATPLLRSYVTPGDLPGQVTDIAVDDDFVWIATLKGLVRLRRDLLGG